jgi:RHS repeat-associated protein
VTLAGTLTLPDTGNSLGPLEWLGARVYDPANRSFLTVDPLPPVTGAGWAANPYSYAGNNPLAMSDPAGTHPLTDTELHAWNQAHPGGIANAWNTATNWVSDNWEYIAGAAMIVAGGALMATGLGGPIGVLLIGAASGALMGAGMSVIDQKTTTGTVDWGEVGSQAIRGAGAGAIGAGVGTLGLHALAAVSARIASRGATAAVETGLETVTSGVGSGAVQTASTDLVVAGDRLLGSVEPVKQIVFMADANGVIVPTSRNCLVAGFERAGLPAAPTLSPGMKYTFPDGSIVRVMEPSGSAQLRASFTNSNHGPISPFTGKPVQPPRGLSTVDRHLYVRDRTHVNLRP